VTEICGGITVSIFEVECKNIYENG